MVEQGWSKHCVWGSGGGAVAVLGYLSKVQLLQRLGGAALWQPQGRGYGRASEWEGDTSSVWGWGSGGRTWTGESWSCGEAAVTDRRAVAVGGGGWITEMSL
ncbi:unnamed protein product [Cuscuta epithymum]|uniref:Uncharacterized protein n=1 Tax=Cuscuta epithymum TaxID=186058 RepID=A0AAV0G6G7_9ASTE|nr:unnamed protein product [Cuscuta epithymum]